METITMNSTPNVPSNQVTSFVNTRRVLANLHESFKCQDCHKKVVDIYHLGSCDHCFCSSCADPKVGKVCPICGLPPDASKVKVDLQLSNIASLCHQMVQLFDDDMVHKITENDALMSSKTENSASTSISTFSRGTKTDDQLKSSEKTRGKSKIRNSLDSLHSEGQEEEKTCLATEVKNTSSKRGRRKSAKSYLNHSQSDKKQQIAEVSDPSLDREESNQDKSPESVHGRRKGRSRKANQTNAQEETPSHNTNKKPKANLCKRNAKGETPLQVATIKCDLRTVKKLLEDGANPNVKDNAGWTPLHEAVNYGNNDIAAVLIAHGASVNAPGLENDTPLHDAVSNYRLDCVRVLISKGANLFARNSHGQTPIDLAQTDEMKQLLLLGLSNSDDAQTKTQSLFEDADTSLCFLASMLEKDEQAVMEKFAKLFNCRTVEHFTSDVTHLVTSTDVDGVPPRTMKYLSSIITGKWIITSQWLQACIDRNKIVPEKDFLVSGSRSHPNAPLNAVKNRLKQLPRLFDGCQFYLYSKFPFSHLQRDQIAQLIKLGGGVMLSREPRLHNLDDYPYTRPYHAQNSASLCDCTIYKIYDDGCGSNPPSVQSQRMSCLPLTWLVDSISAFTLLEKTS